MERDPGKAKQETTKTADHMSTESDKSPNGVCSLVFFFFRGFCMVCSRWPEPRKRNKKNKTAKTTCPQSQTRAPMGSAVLFFLLFCFFEVFAWFALLYTVVITSNCPLLCEIHVEPFKNLQNLAKSKLSHLPPLTPRSLSIYIYMCVFCICFVFILVLSSEFDEDNRRPMRLRRSCSFNSGIRI